MTPFVSFELSDVVEVFGGAENARVENAGEITYGKPSEEKTLRCQ